MKRIILLLILGVGLLSGCANSGSGGLTVRGAWARQAKAGENSAIYFVIHNPGASDDQLLSAECAAAELSQVHMTTIDADGKAAMSHQEQVPVPARQQVEFKPGGLHVMLMNLRQDLAAGQKLPVKLTFAKAGAIQIEAEVRAP